MKDGQSLKVVALSNFGLPNLVGTQGLTRSRKVGLALQLARLWGGSWRGWCSEVSSSLVCCIVLWDANLIIVLYEKASLHLLSVDFRFTSVFEQAQVVEWMRLRMHFNQQDISIYPSLRLRDFSDHLLTRCLTGPCGTNSRTRVCWNNSEQALRSLVLLVCSRQVEMHCRNEQGDLSWLGY